tara:strand:+ start:2946 stop:3395 length:450 start_codon:yes stop_codon:yes gene_type:complete
MLEDLLNSEGLKAVELYRKSFTDNDRVATGKTNQSVAYEVVKTDGSITLSVYGRKDINDLEDGVSADEYAANPASLSDLEQWISARGLNRTAQSIDEGLRRNGWVSGNGEFGGTPDIITTPTNQILKSLESKVTAASKDFVLNQINITV